MQVRQEVRDAVQSRRQESLTSTIHREMERMILAGDLAPGERINEQQLALKLGVSRGPIREAARLLERDGLVVSVMSQGVFVRQLSLEEAAELYDLRASIAGYVCARLAASARTGEKAQLRDLVERMDACLEKLDEDGYFELNLEFHDRIADLSGARRAARIYSALDKEVRLLRRRVLQGAESMRFSNEEHKEILAAIEAGDVAAARKAAEKHHLNGKQRWIGTL